MEAGSFDYIVVGSGSAGGVIASRLSENEKYKVLCLEAGTRGPNYIWARPPTGNVMMIGNPKVDWCYYSEPNETHGNRPIQVPRGKMLGGSSSINGMVYNRGQQIDYDTWAQMGCRGWSYDDILPYLKKLESSPLGSDEYRGRSGPIKVTQSKKVVPFYDLFIKSANAVGIPQNEDYNGASQEGVCMAQMSVRDGRRESTATEYLEPARARPNMTILSGAEVTSLILEGKRCVGVRFRINGGMREARATREVIVSCGAANSPKLLELSGIGNPDILGKHGIETVHELRGVGENLRDHFAAVLKFRFNRPGISLMRRGRGLGLAREVLRYVFLRTGFIAQGLNAMQLFMRSRPDLENPDVLMIIVPFLIDAKPGERRKMSPVDGFFIYPHVQRTESTGSIHIRSADPFAPPAINFRFLVTPNDQQTAIAAFRHARAIVQAEPIAGMIAEEFVPGPHVQSDEDILDSIRKNGQIIQHMVGTCRMGQGPMAVVDERLRVHGIKGLRVADASIMPTITSGNTSIPTIMIGEKAAAMILEDAAKPAA